MYDFIKGEIESIRDGSIIIDNGGIGYFFNVSNNCLSRIGKVGDTVKMYAFLNVREDDMSLFGFYSANEREMFLKLKSVSGIGGRLAMSVLSGMKLETLTEIIISKDVKTLSTIKGVGKKTAERIIVEISGSLTNADSDGITLIDTDNSDIADAIEALVSMGIPRQNAYSVISRAKEHTSDTGQLVKYALKELYK